MKPIIQYSSEDVQRALDLLKQELMLHVIPTAPAQLEADIIAHWRALCNCDKLDIASEFSTEPITGKTVLKLTFEPVTAKPAPIIKTVN